MERLARTVLAVFEESRTLGGDGLMDFNKLTFVLMVISLSAGLWLGIRAEQAHQRNLRDNWFNGESVQDQMKRDGWSL